MPVKTRNFSSSLILILIAASVKIKCINLKIQRIVNFLKRKRKNKSKGVETWERLN
jgi:hypothetical protein